MFDKTHNGWWGQEHYPNSPQNEIDDHYRGMQADEEVAERDEFENIGGYQHYE